MEFRETLVRAGKRLLEKKLTVGTWGNLSLRDPATGLVYITPSAMAYDRISPEDVVVMTLSGERVAGERKPTVETALHLGIYGARPEICAIVHTHPVQSLVFACLHEDIPPVIDEAAQSLGGTVRCAAYALPGTKALAQWLPLGKTAWLVCSQTTAQSASAAIWTKRSERQRCSR